MRVTRDCIQLLRSSVTSKHRVLYACSIDAAEQLAEPRRSRTNGSISARRRSPSAIAIRRHMGTRSVACLLSRLASISTTKDSRRRSWPWRCRGGRPPAMLLGRRALDGTAARLQPLTRSMDCWCVLLSALTARRQKWFVAGLHFFPKLGNDAQPRSQRADYIFYRHTFSLWPFRSDAVSRGLGAETITGDPTPSPANGAT